MSSFNKPVNRVKNQTNESAQIHPNVGRALILRLWNQCVLTAVLCLDIIGLGTKNQFIFRSG